MNDDDKKAFTSGAIIHGFALLHASTAAILAQTLVFDEAALISLSIAMILALSRINGQDWEIGEGLALIGSMAGFYLGNRGAAFLLKWIPGIGNAVNAMSTSFVTEMIGWSAYELMRNGLHPSDLSQTEMIEVKKNADISSQKYKTVKQRLEKMPNEDRQAFKKIISELSSKDLSDARRDELLSELSEVISKYFSYESLG